MEHDIAETANRPDVVVIVLDCVRNDFFEQALNDPSRMPFLRELSTQVVQYSRAVAPGSWTIPSHASLFTGLYPWDHCATYRTGVVLPPEHRTIAELLSGLGYQTASFSGNGLIQPGTGLTRGFAHSLWAGDREFYLRFLRSPTPSCRPLSLPGAKWYPAKSATNESSILGSLGKLSSRSLALWDGLNRVGERLCRVPEPSDRVVARWIEPELKRWMENVPTSRPIFAFVNLFEAHEPYLINGGDRITLREWLRCIPMRNAQERWLAGRGSPSLHYLSEVVRSYARMLDALDRRVKAIVELLQRRGRWRRTLFVLTSDHGQSFWEFGLLGHRLLVTDSLTRIPLWVKFPEGSLAGTTQAGWCSLIDIPATIALSVSGEQFGDHQAINLLAGAKEKSSRMVYSAGDGITRHEARGMVPQKRVALDQLRVAAYRGDAKVVVERGKRSTVEMPLGSRPRVLGSDNEGVSRCEELESAAADMLERFSAHLPRSSADLIDRRLAAWGY